jgi:membrane-bound ClpP family serine protease
LAIDIAVLAPGTYLGASVPRVPVSVYFPMLRHDWL